MILLETQRC